MRLPPAIAFLLLLLAAPASAAPSLVARDHRAPEPLELNGDSLLWTVGDVGLLHRAAPGAPARSVRRLGSYRPDPAYPGGDRVGSLSASGSRAVYTTHAWDTAASKYGHRGPLGMQAKLIDLDSHAVTPVMTCGQVPPGSAALGGSLLVTSGCDSGPVELRDLDRPGDPPRRLADSGTGVAIAGRHVAWRTATGFTVLNLDTGGSRQIEAASLPGTTVEWALDEDGTLAFGLAPAPVLVSQPGPATRIAVAPADGSPTRVVADPGELRSLALVRGRLAFLRVFARPPPGADEAVVMTLDGRARVLARFGDGTGLDFDGRRVAYATGDCRGYRVWTQPADDTATADLTVRACPVDLRGITARVDRRGRLRVAVACPWPSPALLGTRCRLTAAARAGSLRLGAARVRRVSVGEVHTLVWRASRRLLDRRPRRVRLVVRNTMRKRTEKSARRIRVRYR